MNIDAIYGGIMRMVAENPHYAPAVDEKLSSLVKELEERRLIERPTRTSSTRRNQEEYKDTRAWELLCETLTRLNRSPCMSSFTALAKIVSNRHKIHIPRSAKRQKGELVMWFQEHLQQAEHTLPLVKQSLTQRVGDTNDSSTASDEDA